MRAQIMSHSKSLLLADILLCLVEIEAGKFFLFFWWRVEGKVLSSYCDSLIIYVHSLLLINLNTNLKCSN